MVGLQELLRPLDATRDDVLMWRYSSCCLELSSEVVSAEVGDLCHLLQGQPRLEIFFDVLADGAKLAPRQGAVQREVRQRVAELSRYSSLRGGSLRRNISRKGSYPRREPISKKQSQ
jgi:hypothetical protein